MCPGCNRLLKFWSFKFSPIKLTNLGIYCSEGCFIRKKQTFGGSIKSIKFDDRLLRSNWRFKDRILTEALERKIDDIVTENF